MWDKWFGSGCSVKGAGGSKKNTRKRQDAGTGLVRLRDFQADGGQVEPTQERSATSKQGHQRGG